jgi:hypothetical protein
LAETTPQAHQRTTLAITKSSPLTQAKTNLDHGQDLLGKLAQEHLQHSKDLPMSTTKSNLRHHQDLPSISVGDGSWPLQSLACELSWHHKKNKKELLQACKCHHFFELSPELIGLFKCIICNIKTKNNNLKMKEGRKTYFLTCYNVQWRDIDLKMNKNLVLHILKP